MLDSSLDMSAYADSVTAMSRALAAQDQQAFGAALTAFNALRDAAVRTSVRRVTVELQMALQRFEVDSRLIDMARHQVPDARRRLDHVLNLTADAAHHTMDLVEQCLTLLNQLLDTAEALEAARVSGSAQVAIGTFVHDMADNMLAMRACLAEVRQAQGYQDLSGQIIHGVIGLVDELERSLGELAQIADCGATQATAPTGEHGDAVKRQQDVDALLSDLGI